MAILSNLLVNGSGRILNKLFVGDLEVTNSATFDSITAKTSLASQGTLTVGGVTTLNGDVTVATGKTLNLLNNTDAVATSSKAVALIIGPKTGKHLEFDDDEIIAKGSGTTTSALYLNQDGGIVYMSSAPSSGDRVSANAGTLTANNLVGTTGSITRLTGAKATYDNVNVLDTLRAVHYELNTITALGGHFYVAPVRYYSSSVSVFISSINGTTVTATIADPNSITESVGGVQWTQYSKIKISGNIGGVVLSDATGTLTSGMNTSTGTITCQFTYPDASLLEVNKTYSGTEVKDLAIMVYEKGIDANTSNPVGIFMTGYGTNNASYIDMYQGETTRNKPIIRLGKLDELDSSITVGGVAPHGWGLYAENVFLKGTINATAGSIGGFEISSNAIKTANVAVTSNVDNSISLSSEDFNRTINNENRTGLRFAIGDKLGITGDGIIYASNLQALGGSIGGFHIVTTQNKGTSAQGGHYYTNGFYRHAGDGVDYEYEVGIKGDATENPTSAENGGTTNTNLAFYINRIPKGATWTSSNITQMFYIRHNGEMYCKNAKIEGNITAIDGSIGGWVIDSDNLSTGTWGTDNSAMLCIGTTDSKQIGGSESISGWVFTAGQKFGVTKTGVMYCSEANIEGKITATSGSIGNCDIVDGTLVIGQSHVQNLTTDLENITDDIDSLHAMYGTCNTDAGTAVKEVVCENFVLEKGAVITISFTKVNTADTNLMLNINSTGNKNIKFNGSNVTSTNKLRWAANAVITFRYDGTHYIPIDQPKTWYGTCTAAATTAGKTIASGCVGCVVCAGATFVLSMTNNNTATAPTFNARATGALNLYAGNSTIRPLESNGLSWTAGSTTSLVFDGSVWRVQDTASLARAEEASKTATNYLYYSNNDGLVIHQNTTQTGTTFNATSAGANARVKSGGFYIFNNDVLLAEYGATTKFYKTGTSTVAAQLDSNGLSISKGSITLGSKFSVGTDGTLNASGVIVSGNITATEGTIGDCSISNGVLQVAAANITSVNASKITSGTLSAERIAAKSINASKLILSDPTNYVTVNESRSGSAITEYHPFKQTTTQNNTTTTTWNHTLIENGYIKKTSSSNLYIPLCGYTQSSFEQGDELYYTITMHGDANGTAVIRIYFYTPSGGTDNTDYVGYKSGQTINFTTTDNTYTGTITIDATNANAGMYAICVFDTTDTKGMIYCKQVSIRKKANASLIVDGSITADKIDTNAVTADKIASGAITADKIDASSISVGGRNLIRGTRTMTVKASGASRETGTFYPSYSTVGTSLTNVEITDSPVLGVTQGILLTANENQLRPGYAQEGYQMHGHIGDVITYSVWVKVSRANSTITLQAFWVSAGNPESSSKVFTVETPNTWVRLSYTTAPIQYDHDAVNIGYVYLKNATAGDTCMVCAPMEEYGLFVSDWSPSPDEVAGFTIDPTSIHTANVAVTTNSNNSIALSSADFARTINGTERSGLRFAIGSKFGVTGEGKIFATDVDLTGVINANSGKIGAWTLDSAQLYGTSSVTQGTASTQYGAYIIKPTASSTQVFRTGSRSYDGSAYGSWDWKTYMRADGYFFSKSGQIGGWTIGENSLSCGTYGSDNGIYLSTAQISTTDQIIGGRSGSDWRFTVGSGFGVTNTGALYCNSGCISNFHIASTASNTTSANGGHIFANSLYRHSGDGTTYEYEFGMKGDTTENPSSASQSHNNLAFYVKRISKGGNWASSATDMFYVRYNGSMYCKNAEIEGKVIATDGSIGGWSIEDNYLYCGTLGSDNGIYLSTAQISSSSTSIGGRSGNDWRFAVGSHFGVTNTGVLYCNSVHLNGEVTATSGSIGGFHIVTTQNKGTSAQGGHYYTNGFYRHSGDGTDYEYEVGIKGDATENPASASTEDGGTTNANLAFYIKRITKGTQWTSTNATDMFYVRHNGEMYCRNAHIGDSRYFIAYTDGVINGNLKGIKVSGESLLDYSNANSASNVLFGFGDPNENLEKKYKGYVLIEKIYYDLYNGKMYEYSSVGSMDGYQNVLYVDATGIYQNDYIYIYYRENYNTFKRLNVQIKRTTSASTAYYIPSNDFYVLFHKTVTTVGNMTTYTGPSITFKTLETSNTSSFVTATFSHSNIETMYIDHNVALKIADDYKQPTTSAVDLVYHIVPNRESDFRCSYGWGQITANTVYDQVEKIKFINASAFFIGSITNDDVSGTTYGYNVAVNDNESASYYGINPGLSIRKNTTQYVRFYNGSIYGTSSKIIATPASDGNLILSGNSTTNGNDNTLYVDASTIKLCSRLSSSDTYKRTYIYYGDSQNGDRCLAYMYYQNSMHCLFIGGTSNATNNTNRFKSIFMQCDNLYKGSGGSDTTISDYNMKKDFQPINNYSEFIMGLNPQKFRFKDGTSNRYHTGFIAQEVEKTALETIGDFGVFLSVNFGGPDEDVEDTHMLRYDEIIAPHVALTQDHEREIRELKQRISDLELQIKELSKAR